MWITTIFHANFNIAVIIILHIILAVNIITKILLKVIALIIDITIEIADGMGAGLDILRIMMPLMGTLDIMFLASVML